MGRVLIETVLGAADARLVGALEQRGNPHVGRDAGELAGQACGILISDQIDEALAGADVLIDFTRPEGTLDHLAACRNLGVKIVIGTTGFSEAQRSAINEASRDLAIAMAPNFSVGVNLTFKLLDTAARVLREGYDFEIVEAHHRHKVDAPSGTALRMGEIIAQAAGRDLQASAVYGRQGVTGERKSDTIGFATIRGGDVVGDHTAMFLGTGERIEITHRSNSRATYAQGALRAARYITDRKSGLYDMQDVLGLR
ncbi:MAG: 4-hydroxy-tetrahydrodipicolinate reductase [Burkholderiales bacterium]